MRNGLYMVDVTMSAPSPKSDDTTNMPETDDFAMVMDRNGVFFVKLHPAKIGTTPRRGCIYCNELQVNKVTPHTAEGCMTVRPANFCFNCGRRYRKKEAPGA